ncbi:hypothetical protein OAG71_00550 [bacterium]|nr:hypothetical protein [bacterium]
MQFQIAHLLLLSIVVAFVLAMRSWASSIGDESIVAWSIIGSAVLISLGFRCSGFSACAAILTGTIFALFVSGSHALECIYHSTATDYLRQHTIDAQYADDKTLLTAATIAITFISAIAASFAAGIGHFIQSTLRKKTG